MKTAASQVYQVNLQEHLEQYAWKRLRDTKGFLKTLFLRKSQHYVDIKWGYLNFEHKTKELPRPKVAGDKEQNDTPVELYNCEYENKTDGEQIHKFSTSRETTATTRVEFQENYTIGTETNIEVDIGVVKVGGGVNGGLSVTKTGGQDYSQSLSWNIDTEIKVPSKQKAVAKLHVSENQTITDFEVETTVTLPKKKLPVSIRRRSDDTSIHTIWIQNIDAIFDAEYLKKAKDLIEIKEFSNDADKKIYIGLILKSHGTCRNVSFRNQNVTVEWVPLTDDIPKKTEMTTEDINNHKDAPKFKDIKVQSHKSVVDGDTETGSNKEQSTEVSSRSEADSNVSTEETMKTKESDEKVPESIDETANQNFTRNSKLPLANGKHDANGIVIEDSPSPEERKTNNFTKLKLPTSYNKEKTVF